MLIIYKYATNHPISLLSILIDMFICVPQNQNIYYYLITTKIQIKISIIIDSK